MAIIAYMSFKMLCMVFEINTAIKNTKNILLCAYWPSSATVLSSEAASREEGKICFFFSIAIA